ncbi:dermonecrotic toxin domain-containing protein [Pseudomonas brassicacearum]|uniref:SET domain-containing protein n=1 Tax=Pseudomonas brassicacearum subsp. neoaurantiaca TaxID=494916 RepID=A0A7V8RJ95_9PSED|nr:DUF6543 domain-containing protein [Pseudomonas brassicacearum]MBA1377547.1 hypothetical protein [Pseudomonas brassicacearum subsp. neoaurantiaca]
MNKSSSQPHETPPSRPSVHPHEAFIKTQLPSWIKNASPAMLTELRQHLISSNQSRHDIKEILDELKSPEAFARPLVRDAIRKNFFGLLNDENALLVREWKNSHLLGLVKTHDKTTEQTLLEAALQNFEASETVAGGMEEGTGLYNLAETGRILTAVPPSRFAAACRQLDAGSQYLKHINEVLEPTPQTGATRTAAQVLDAFRRHERNCFGADLLLAHIRGELEPDIYLQLRSLQRDSTHPELSCSHLTIKQVVLPNVLVIQQKRANKQIILYTPQDPILPFRSYWSMRDLHHSLAERLSTPGYLAFFNRLIPLQHRGTILKVLPAQVYWLPADLRTQSVRASLNEPVALAPIQGNMFHAMAAQRITQIRNDARVVAIPTADVDILSRQNRLQYYADLGKSALFFAASFVPVIGEVLLVVSAAQLTETVYDGFAAWSRGDSDQALNDLLDIVDNAALAVATSGAIRGAGFTANLVKVQVRNKGWRLWQPSLAAYRHPMALPKGLPANAQGIYQHGERHYLKLDDGVHAIQRDPQNQHWQLLHPTDPKAYSPPLLSNNVGGWRLLQETPNDWDDLKLLKRLGPEAANIKPAAVESILLLGGIDNMSLRQIHQDLVRPPPLLRETVKRFNLEQEINDFSTEHAQGASITLHSPFLQLYSVCSLPKWPGHSKLSIVDEHQSVLFTRGTGPGEIRVSETRFRKGELLHALEEQMPQLEFNTLLPTPYVDGYTKVENLAMTLPNQVRENRQLLFTWLSELGEKAEDPIQQDIHRVMPELSRSHLEEMAAVLSPEQRVRIAREKSLTSAQRWEASRYIEHMRINRARENIHLNSVSNDEGLSPILDTLDQLPGWPASRRIEIRGQNINGSLLGSNGSEFAETHYLLTRQGGLYTPHDATGKLLHGPTDLFSALEHTLSNAERSAVLSQSNATTFKEAIRQTDLRLMATRPLAVRAKTSGVLAPAMDAQPLDPLFALPDPPSGLTLRSDGLYQSKPFPDGFYRHYIRDKGQYFQVKTDSLGIQLIDARSPFRAYRPYIRKDGAGGWSLDETNGKLLGGMPSPLPTFTDGESNDEFESAESSTGYETADDNLQPAPYTAEELLHMRAEKSYQYSQNYRRIYLRANNGRYPIRDTDGLPMRIRRIQNLGISPISHRTFSKDLVLPYIKWEGYEQVASLYEEKLEVVPFTAAHQKFPEENVLIGQLAVVNKRPLGKGEIIGVYGGELLPVGVAGRRQDPYLIDITPIELPSSTNAASPPPVRSDVVLSGDNILSRMNTIVEYEEGAPARQAAAGYNVEAAYFNVDVQKGSQPQECMKLTAFFTTEDIPANTELRWNYQYDDEAVKVLFGLPLKSSA